MRFRSSLLSMALLLLLVPEVKAVDIYNNLNQAVAGARSINNTNFAALSFKTTATETVLTSLSAYLQVTSAATGTLTYSIYDATGSGGLPSTKITDAGTISSSSITTSYATYSIPSLNIALSASTNYWLVLSNSTGNIVGLGLTSSSTGTTGSTGVASYNGSFWGTLPPYYAMGAVTAVAPVPEPSTYALAAIATGVMAAVARRRKARLG